MGRAMAGKRGNGTVEAVRAALAAEPRIDLPRHRLSLAFDGGVLTLEGEVADVAAKKLALERAAAVAGVGHIVDRVRVRPARAMTDAEIRDHLCDALLDEAVFRGCAVRCRHAGGARSLREPVGAVGWIEVDVVNAVVTLSGEAPSLGHKRLAGVLAWWVPGSRDVVNGLEVVPGEEDSEDEIADAVRIALEKDPLVDPSGIRVDARGAVVSLEGSVHSKTQREMAEADAWCVFGVDAVRNRLEVRG